MLCAIYAWQQLRHGIYGSKMNPTSRRGLAYHLGVFAFLLGSHGSERGRREEKGYGNDRQREAGRQRQAEEKRKAERQRQAEKQREAAGRRHREAHVNRRDWWEHQLGAFAFLLGPRALWEAARREPQREQETESRRREEKQRNDERRREAERQRQAEEKRKAERRRQAEEKRQSKRQREQERERRATRDWWKELAVAPDASIDEITRAYRRKVQQYHPDRVSGLGPELIELAEHHTRALNAAYAEAKRVRR
jgi:DnaJ-domain-containing protein 1